MCCALCTTPGGKACTRRYTQFWKFTWFTSTTAQILTGLRQVKCKDLIAMEDWYSEAECELSDRISALLQQNQWSGDDVARLDRLLQEKEAVLQQVTTQLSRQLASLTAAEEASCLYRAAALDAHECGWSLGIKEGQEDCEKQIDCMRHENKALADALAAAQLDLSELTEMTKEKELSINTMISDLSQHLCMTRQTLSASEQEWSNAERNLHKQIHELSYKLTSLERTSHDKENESERQLQASAEDTRDQGNCKT